MSGRLRTGVINYYTEGVRKFQPRVCLKTLGKWVRSCPVATLKELRRFVIDAGTSQPLQGFD